MQVFGLPGHLIRSARSASRLLAAKTPDIEAERRRDAVARWLMARAAGLTAEAAARAVGASRSTLHRWRRRAAPLGLLVAALTADPSAVPVSRPTRIALLLTLRLGFRALETRSLEWRAVSLDGDQPAVSVTTSKTAAGLRTLPLPPAAVEELRQLNRPPGKTLPTFSQPNRARSGRFIYTRKACHEPSRGRALGLALPARRRMICAERVYSVLRMRGEPGIVRPCYAARLRKRALC